MKTCVLPLCVSKHRPFSLSDGCCSQTELIALTTHIILGKRWFAIDVFIINKELIEVKIRALSRRS